MAVVALSGGMQDVRSHLASRARGRAPGYAGRNLLTLKCDPVWSEQLRAEHPDILPGFYSDKRNWISVDVDGDVPDDLLCELCDHSYRLVFAKLTKKVQREIGG